MLSGVPIRLCYLSQAASTLSNSARTAFATAWRRALSTIIPTPVGTAAGSAKVSLPSALAKIQDFNEWLAMPIDTLNASAGRKHRVHSPLRGIPGAGSKRCAASEDVAHLRTSPLSSRRR